MDYDLWQSYSRRVSEENASTGMYFHVVQRIELPSVEIVHQDGDIGGCDID